jgi:predicted AAA+ superfamily ATPase
VAVTNKERVGRMLDVLALGLRPVVEEEFTKAYGKAWVSVVLAKREMDTGSTASADPNDPQFLLNAVFFHWKETLGKTLGVAERNYVAELRETRNRWAHAGAKPFSTDDVYRAFDTAERLLRAVAAPQSDDLMKAKLAVLRESIEAQQKSRERATATAPVAAEPAKGLPGWRSVIVPHHDVAAGAYRQAEFAADLAQVARGEGVKEYVDPREFFARTYITEGLRLLLVGALKRLSGSGGESVVDLQTTFGGGKTHSMLALWHIADPAVDIAHLPGLEPVLAEAGVVALPKVARAALVGTWVSPVTPRVVASTEIRTLWGELAWQLGRESGFAHVAVADREGVPPGAEALRDLLAAHAPVVVLIDEWVTYARLQWGKDTLPGGTFDAALSFAQQLTQAIDQVPGALLVVSLPSSAIEVGGEGGQKALEALKHVIHRVDAPWRPAAAQESFEIVRRRLFEPIGLDDAKSRDEVVQRFSELYAQHVGVFPSDTKEKAYLERLRSCYPIHPELFDRLFDDWSTLERFQRTRGVLKLMAAVVHALWEKQDPNLLILPAAIPLDDTLVLSQLTQYLDDNWTPIIESDVDGVSSLPLHLDRENAGTYGRYSAARRVARTVFLGSAPLPAAANRGIDDKRILLGSVQPGEQPATFGDALRRLAGQATYLYEQGGRYWYATQPSVNQLARDRADQLKGGDLVAVEAERRLKLALSDRGPFARVHSSPKGGSDVPDEDEVALVALGPEYPHDPKASESRAAQAAKAILSSRGAGDRTNQNMLVFLAPDSLRLAELMDAAGQYLAWKSICDDGDAGKLNLDSYQRGQARSQRDAADETVRVRVGETYIWLLVPEQADGTAKVGLRTVKLSSGPDPLAIRAGAKLRNEELLVVKFGGVNLRLALIQKLGTYWDAHHEVGLRELWSWFARYVYLPRLRDVSVLEGAVRDGAGNILWRSETFAYAAAREEPAEYRGLVAGRAADTPITSTSLIVDGSVLPDPLAGPETKTAAPDPGLAAGSGSAPTPSPARVARFSGEAVLADPCTPFPELEKLVKEIIGPLATQADVSLTVRVEIEASHAGAGGFSDQTIRTVSENARTLRLRKFDFEKD